MSSMGKEDWLICLAEERGDYESGEEVWGEPFSMRSFSAVATPVPSPSYGAGKRSHSVPVRCQGLPEKRQHLPLLCREPLDHSSGVRLV